MRCRTVGTVRAHFSGWLARRMRFLFGFCNAMNYLFVPFFLIADIFVDFFLDTGNSFLIPETKRLCLSLVQNNASQRIFICVEEYCCLLLLCTLLYKTVPSGRAV